MSAGKYYSIFLRQMETIVYLYPSNIFPRARSVLTHHVTEYSQAKTGNYPSDLPHAIFKPSRVGKNI